MAQLEISIMALGRPDTSASRYVAEAIRVAQRYGIEYSISAMGTTLEGDVDTILKVAREMHEAPFTMGIQRVYSVIKLDDRRDRESTLEQKVKSLEDKLDISLPGPKEKSTQNTSDSVGPVNGDH